MRTKLIILIIIFMGVTIVYSNQIENRKSFYDFVVKTIDGKDFSFSKLKGKKVLIVNTASKCGLTPQYKILQEIYNKLDKQKFEIIAFPANNFLKQEPGSNKEIKEFCSKNYGVTFPVMAKISVTGYIYNSYPPDPNKATSTSIHELYQWLTQKNRNGVLDTRIKWNFHKFLIDEAGNLITDLPPTMAKEILSLKTWLE